MAVFLCLARQGLEWVALLVHYMAAEAVDIVGKANPWRCASSEGVGIGLNPRCVVIGASINNLHFGKTLQGDAKAGTASGTECVVQ